MTQMFTTKMNTSSSQQHEEIDILSRSFNSQLLSAHDCYRSFISNSLINTTRRYINTKLQYEDNSINFIEEIRRKLYLIHEYNLEIFKLTHKYPRIRNFDLLLVKYIELEYEILYGNGKNVDKSLEREVGQRVYRLLYIILQYCTVEDGLLTGTADITTKEAILQVFVDIKFQYFKEGRFLYNITSKLINDIDGKCNISSCNLLFHYLKANFSTSKNLTTSDYGSDDSDTDEINCVIDSSHCTNTQIRPVELSLINTSNTNDIEEVPVTKNGIQPIVTFELINDDDDDYMVYLTEKQCSHQSDKSKNCDKIGDPTIINTNSNNKGDNTNVVVLSSDSENDSIRSIKSNRKKKKRLKNQQKRSIVTFEIVDDDDDDGDNANSYMVYLEKEVENLNKRKKLTIEDAVILSDSDNDNVGNIKKEPMEIDTKIESSIGEITESQNMLNQSNQIKIEPEEIDLKVEIIEEQERNIDYVHNNDQLTSELYLGDPCLNIDKTDSTLIVQNNTNVGNLTDSSLNNSFLEEMLETSYLLKKDFEDLECFVLDTSGQHSFSRYCEQSSDNDDGIFENKLM